MERTKHNDAPDTARAASGVSTVADEQGLAFRIFDLATGDDDARLCRDIPEDQCREQPRNFVCQVAAQALSKTGDTLADAKVVLPWLMGAVGAPVSLIGLLVPIRESLALLPQILVGGFIRRFAVRKGFWSVASVVEGVCVILMAVVAATGLTGVAAGWSIVGLLFVFSVARGIASIAAKDTLGKTVSKGRRGRVSGYASTIAGAIATAVGLYLALTPEAGRPAWLLYVLITAAGVSWLLAAATFATIREHPGATAGGRGLGDLVRDQLVVLVQDRELQKFLLARALMISTALFGPIYVSLAQAATGRTLGGLGWLIIASGLAGVASSMVWGALSDRSSRLTLVAAAGLAGTLGFAVLLTRPLLPAGGVAAGTGFYAGILFILGVAHAGVRIGRKTHIVDLAGGDRKAEYVALSNTVIGALLLVIGALIGGLLSIGPELAIATLSAMALCGAGLALTLQHAQA